MNVACHKARLSGFSSLSLRCFLPWPPSCRLWHWLVSLALAGVLGPPCTFEILFVNEIFFQGQRHSCFGLERKQPLNNGTSSEKAHRHGAAPRDHQSRSGKNTSREQQAGKAMKALTQANRRRRAPATCQVVVRGQGRQGQDRGATKCLSMLSSNNLVKFYQEISNPQFRAINPKQIVVLAIFEVEGVGRLILPDCASFYLVTPLLPSPFQVKPGSMPYLTFHDQHWLFFLLNGLLVPSQPDLLEGNESDYLLPLFRDHW